MFPEDRFGDSECESDDSDKETKKNCAQLSHDSDCDNESSDECDDNDIHNLWATMWVKMDKTTYLGAFTKDLGEKQIPTDSTKESEMTVKGLINLVFTRENVKRI